MKLYILRWNPVFSMKYEYFNSQMNYLREDIIDDFDWSIRDFEDLEIGDMFILAQVGTGERDGIAAFGLFNTEAYTDENWKNENDGTNCFYADMDIHCMISHEEESNEKGSLEEVLPFCAEALEKNFPDINWHKGDSGVLIPEKMTEPLILYLMSHILPLEHSTERISFTEQDDENSLRIFFAQYINGLCPKFKQKIINTNKLVYKNYKEGESIDKSIIEISEEIFNRVTLKKNSPIDDFVKIFVPEA
ncbi:MAG: hypothetical protein J6Y36_02245 [Treponema sp.]|nr:hypothetical protein [Treponema sp.]